MMTLEQVTDVIIDLKTQLLYIDRANLHSILDSRLWEDVDFDCSEIDVTTRRADVLKMIKLYEDVLVKGNYDDEFLEKLEPPPPKKENCWYCKDK